jgi:hypothetical protein
MPDLRSPAAGVRMTLLFVSWVGTWHPNTPRLVKSTIRQCRSQLGSSFPMVLPQAAPCAHRVRGHLLVGATPGPGLQRQSGPAGRSAQRAGQMCLLRPGFPRPSLRCFLDTGGSNIGRVHRQRAGRELRRWRCCTPRLHRGVRGFSSALTSLPWFCSVGLLQLW